MSTVTVCCGLPGGLVARLFTFEDVRVPHAASPSGWITERRSKEVARCEFVGAVVKPAPGAPTLPAARVGYGLTFNVDESFWAKWLEQNKDSDLVRNRIVFAHRKRDAARGEAKERETGGARTGFEPMNMSPAPAGKHADGRIRFLPADERARAVSRGGLSIETATKDE